MSGKGSGRRPCDEEKVRSNWDSIFGKKDKEQPKETNELPNKTS
jgi:hypothetical protein